MPWAGLVALAGVALWLLVDPRTPDLAAQVYRVSLFRHQGFALWDEHWYAGHLLPGYSLTFPPLAALFGMRTVAALSVLASALLFERLAGHLYGRAGRWGAIWFALAAVADIWIGRLTFALGVTFAVACACALLWSESEGKGEGEGVGQGEGKGWGEGESQGEGRSLRRSALVVALAALCAASSPVAGLLLALLAFTYTLVTRRVGAGLAAILPAVIVVGALASLFPEGGWEPYPTTSLLASVAVIVGFLLALPPGQSRLRAGALVYLGVCLASVALHTPMGANVERYGLLLAGPLLLCALLSASPRPQRFSPIAVAVLCGIALWTLWGPVRETAAVAGDPSTSAAYYVPLERFLETHGGALVRVEVPFTRAHWEAAWLAPSFSLARGWEKQLDTRYNDVLLRKGLTAAKYWAWLREQAVTYVALPDVPLDPSSSQEGRLIQARPPYLREVFASAHWRVYRVLNATPLLQGPGRLTELGHDSFALHASRPGSFIVHIHYTRYWTQTQGSACVGPAPNGWTSVIAARAGTIAIATRFSLGRALGQVYPCGVSAKRPV